MELKSAFQKSSIFSLKIHTIQLFLKIRFDHFGSSSADGADSSARSPIDALMQCNVLSSSGWVHKCFADTNLCRQRTSAYGYDIISYEMFLFEMIS